MSEKQFPPDSTGNNRETCITTDVEDTSSTTEALLENTQTLLDQMDMNGDRQQWSRKCDRYK